MTSFELSGIPLSAITGIDAVIVAFAMAMLLVISWLFGRKEDSTADFFLGSRQVLPIVAALSLIAAELSALTVVGVPALAYSENWQYIQFFIGLAAARIAVCFIFVPVFYKYNCTSIYEFLRLRFGSQTQYAGSAFFLFTRLVAAGVRLYAACMGIAVIMGWSLTFTLLLFTIVSILFIAFGGIKAVVWAGAYQALMIIVAGAVLLIYLISRVEGPLGQAVQIAADAGRLNMFDFRPQLNNPATFWTVVVNAFFIGLAVFGADQEMAQRLLTVQTRKKSQKTIFMTIALGLPVLCLYLAVGTGLFIFYHQHPDITAPAQAKEVISHFVAGILPSGLKGLILAAIILASIDSPLSSLSSSFVCDLYRTIIRPNDSEKSYLIVSRIAVVVFGLILAAIAALCAPVQNILWFAFEIFSITGGAMLGVFLLGILTRSKANIANIFAMVISAVAMSILLLLKKTGRIDLSWNWLIVIGTFSTMLLAWLFGKLESRSAR